MKDTDIEIEYDGEYPNLCSGTLIVTMGIYKWIFPDYCLSSGGSVTFDKEWNENVTTGEWSIGEWPDGFPEKYKKDVLDEVNSEINHGCCGGCV